MSAPRLLIVSLSAFMQKFNHTFLHELAIQSDWDIQLMTPSFWKPAWSDAPRKLEKRSARSYSIAAEKLRFRQSRHLVHFTSHPGLVLKEFCPHLIHLDVPQNSLPMAQLLFYMIKYSPGSRLIINAARESRESARWLAAPLGHLFKRTNGFISYFEPASPQNETNKFHPNVAKIMGGINTDAFRPRDLPELKFRLNPENKTVIGYIGPITEGAGIENLLRSVVDLPCRVILIGDGKHRIHLKSLAQELAVDTKFLPASPQQEIAQYMNCMDIFIGARSPSDRDYYQPFRCLLEAMSSGVAVLGADGSDTPQIIHNSGIVKRDWNPSELRNKIKLLLQTQKHRSQLGWQGRRFIETRCSAKVAASQYLQFYRKFMVE